MHDKEYQKSYREKNKDRIREQRKEYRRLHAEEIRDNKRRYCNLPEVKARRAILGAKLYKRSREKVIARQAARRRERVAFINGVALHYGCQNAECRWRGEFVGGQLDFHHLDPADKVIEVSKMESWSYARIVKEINKCAVLCKNCHVLVHAGLVVVDESHLCWVSEDLQCSGQRDVAETKTS